MTIEVVEDFGVVAEPFEKVLARSVTVLERSAGCALRMSISCVGEVFWKFVERRTAYVEPVLQIGMTMAGRLFVRELTWQSPCLDSPVLLGALQAEKGRRDLDPSQ